MVMFAGQRERGRNERYLGGNIYFVGWFHFGNALLVRWGRIPPTGVAPAGINGEATPY